MKTKMRKRKRRARKSKSKSKRKILGLLKDNRVKRLPNLRLKCNRLNHQLSKWKMTPKY